VAAGDAVSVDAALARDPALARDWRPILEAALYGEADIARRLLAAGADPNAQSVAEARYRPLHRAIEVKKSIPRRPGHREVLTILLDAGADPDAMGCWYDGRALETAARAADHWAAERLMARGGKRDIYAGVLLGDEDLVAAELCRDAGLAKAPGESGTGALHLLCASRLARDGAVEMARRLIAAGASACEPARMRHGTFPPLHFAVYPGDADLEMVTLLLDEGADPQASFYETLWSGDFAAAALLAERGASVDGAWHESGRPLLHEMLHWGRTASAVWLLQAGADPNRRDPQGWTALHYAYSRGASPDIKRRLVEAGADASLTDSQGRRPEAVAKPGKSKS
jgi:ankyrin repeat protein